MRLRVKLDKLVPNTGEKTVNLTFSVVTLGSDVELQGGHLEFAGVRAKDAWEMQEGVDYTLDFTRCL